MSKRSQRHEAERLARRRAYLAALHPESQTAAEPVTASEAQFTANQANAQLSTGPRSSEGKAISSRNHTTHGLTSEHTPGTDFKVLPNENQIAYDYTLASLKKEWKPVTATELDLVNRLATHSWLRDRAIRLQDQVVGEGLPDRDAHRKLSLLMRYQTTHERAFNKAFSDLLRLRNFQMREQKHAQTLQIRFESQQLKNAAHELKMEALRRKQSPQKSTPTEASAPEATPTQTMAAAQMA